MAAPRGSTIAQQETSVVADYTESVVPASARRSNFRMLLTFGSMQLVFGAVLVGYDARFQGLSFTRLIGAMAIAATAMTVYCIGSANVGAFVGQTHAVTTRGIFGWFGGGLILGTSGFGVTYIGSPPIQAWATGAVVYLLLVWPIARRRNADKFLGYSKIEELPEAVSSAPGHA